MATAKTPAKRKSAKSIICDLIMKRKTDDQIIAAVKKEFPESAVDAKHCTKYRKELFNEDLIEADLAARGSTEHREWALENMAQAKKGPHKAFWIQKEKDDKAKAIAAKKAEAAAKKAAIAAKKAA